MTAKELFELLNGEVVSVDGTLCYPQYIEDDQMLEMLDGNLMIEESDIDKINVRGYYIYVYVQNIEEPYAFMVYQPVKVEETA